ncbi:MAG TPA: MBL fold metallo-hydrolase [Saprospiraceae bacterium]|nr:MBL fold metallo-hydrolase [Saprospiraceae bacterium]HQW55685.1 MBL fold metallo-hydrolase [Saprospiraceae bacterium]
MEVKLFASGYCEALNIFLRRKPYFKKSRFYAVWLLIDHPVCGLILFDTGYTGHFYDSTYRFPDRLYRMVTPAYIDERDMIGAILERKGIQCADIRWVIISHFHADHISGLKLFPNAQFYTTRLAWQQVLTLQGLMAIKRGIIHNLIPDDFEERLSFIEDIGEKGIDTSGLVYYKLPQWPEIKLISLPGHAAGMIGLWIDRPDGPFIYATDAAWDSECFYENKLPHPLAKLFFDDWSDYVDTWNKLHTIKSHYPQAKIYFTHSPDTLKICEHVV